VTGFQLGSDKIHSRNHRGTCKHGFHIVDGDFPAAEFERLDARDSLPVFYKIDRSHRAVSRNRSQNRQGDIDPADNSRPASKHSCKHRLFARLAASQRISRAGRRAVRTSSLPFLGICCAAYIAVAVIAFPEDYAAVLWQFAMVFGLSLPLVLAATVGITGFMENPAAPLNGAKRMLANASWQAAKIVVVFLLGVAAYTTLKTNIPNLVPFYADPYLADWDEVLHGGAPWRWPHSLPRHLTSTLMEFFYSIVWFGQWFGTLLFVAMWKGGARKERYLWALAATVLVAGTLAAAAFSSVGPIFYDRFYGGERFAALLGELEASDGAATVTRFASYLLDSYHGGSAAFGTGISAMPSMHVAIATLNALFLGSLQRSLGVAAWTFLAIILFGSVYTGWHYAIDGYISIAIVGAIWWLSGLYFLRARLAAGTALRPAAADTAARARPLPESTGS
jgi:hypothetical protein